MDITDDAVFEIELIWQIEINIGYIIIFVKKYHYIHCKDKEVLITIHKVIAASLELRKNRRKIYFLIKALHKSINLLCYR